MQVAMQLGRRCGVGGMVLLIRRLRLADAGNILWGILDAGALTGWRSTHAIADSVADLGGIQVEFGEGAAKGVAMHTEFIRGFALVALMMREHFEDVPLFEFANGIHVRNACTVHLRD